MKNESISHGTLRTQDLIPAFLDALKTVAPHAHEQFMLLPFGPIPAHVRDEGDESDWWVSEEAQDLLSSLFDALDEHAPEGCYFGAHPGNGSDFGFWEHASELIA